MKPTMDPAGFNSSQNISCCGRELNKRNTCLYCCGSFCILSAMLLSIFWSSIFLFFLSWKLALSPNSITFNEWKETPLPIYMNIVLFNWTNPESSLHGPDKPAFTEMGPYVFSEHHSKQQIVWNDGNSTITFLNRNEWHFLPEMSNGTLNDTIINLNTVALILGSRCYDLGNLTEVVNKIFLEEGSLVVSKTAGELIFDGYNDSLLQNSELKQYLPDFPTFDKFGWYYQRNMSATYDGVLTMYTGQKDIERLGLLTSWNYETRTGCYPGECGEVQSTIGNVLPLSSYKQSQLTLFNTDVCGFCILLPIFLHSSLPHSPLDRSPLVVVGVGRAFVYSLDFEEAIEMYELPGIQYHATASTFDNNETCYCPQQSCPAPGVRDISACKQAPVFISLPHFLYADASYLDAVSGLQPNATKHSFFMSLANVTSIPLVVELRLQTNLLMQSIPNMTFFDNLTTTYMPMYWVQQSAALTEDLAALMSPLYTLSAMGRWVILAIGLVLGAAFIVPFIVICCGKSPVAQDQYYV